MTSKACHSFGLHKTSTFEEEHKIADQALHNVDFPRRSFHDTTEHIGNSYLALFEYPGVDSMSIPAAVQGTEAMTRAPQKH